MKFVGALLACLVAGGLAACQGAAPRSQSLPTAWPSATLTTPTGPGDTSTCWVTTPTPSTIDRQALPDHPTGADLLWYPGMNAGIPRAGGPKTCRTFHTHLEAATAAALVADLKSLRDPPSGEYACPFDDGSFVQAWFATETGALSFRIDLRGCAFDKPTNPADLGTWPAELAPRH